MHTPGDLPEKRERGQPGSRRRRGALDRPVGHILRFVWRKTIGGSTATDRPDVNNDAEGRVDTKRARVIPGVACGGGWCRSRRPCPGGGPPCNVRRFASRSIGSSSDSLSWLLGPRPCSVRRAGPHGETSNDGTPPDSSWAELSQFTEPTALLARSNRRTRLVFPYFLVNQSARNVRTRGPSVVMATVCSK